MVKLGNFLIGLFLIMCVMASGLMLTMILDVILYNSIESFVELPFGAYYLAGSIFGMIGLSLKKFIKIKE